MEHILDQHLDGLDIAVEADQEALYQFFGGDLELFKEVQNDL